MNARKEVLTKTLQLQENNYLLELATGSGKSKLAIEKVKQLHSSRKESLLIVIPRNVLKVSWEEELNKWWSSRKNISITYTTYISFPKHKGYWDYVIFDECHHLSARCREALSDFTINHSILLSATVGRELKKEIKDIFKDLQMLKLDLRDAINDGILPDPKVYLLPLSLNNTFPTEVIIKNPKAKGRIIECSWETRWQYLRLKSNPVRIYCTEYQYICDLNSQIDWWKKRYMQTRNEGVKAKWLRLCADRLQYLANKKNPLINALLDQLKDKRTLTFCSSIEQTEILGKNCINSKNKESEKILQDFNTDKICHITACNMLNEGMNLTNCQVGIYANLNSSETIVKQRAGRLLRHKNPIIIIPYYKGTREEELVEKMLENYNVELISSIEYTNNFKL